MCYVTNIKAIHEVLLMVKINLQVHVMLGV